MPHMFLCVYWRIQNRRIMNKKKRKVIVIDDDDEEPKRVRYTHTLSAFQTRARAALLQHMEGDVAWLCVQYSSTALDYLPTILGSILTNRTLTFIDIPSPQPNRAVRMAFRLDAWGTRSFIQDNYKQETPLTKQVRRALPSLSVYCGDSQRRLDMFCGIPEAFEGLCIRLTQDDEAGFVWKLLDDDNTSRLTTREERIAAAARHLVKKACLLRVAKPHLLLAVRLRPWKALDTLDQTHDLLRRTVEQDVLMDMQLGSVKVQEFQVMKDHAFVGGGKDMLFALIDLDLSH